MSGYRVRRGLGVVILACSFLLLAGGIAAAQTDGDTTYPTIPTTTTTDPCTHVDEGGVCGVVVAGASASRDSLPFTGGNVALLTIVGLAAVGAGVTIVLVGRRRSTSSA